jgi:hypothetical protein
VHADQPRISAPAKKALRAPALVLVLRYLELPQRWAVAFWALLLSLIAREIFLSMTHLTQVMAELVQLVQLFHSPTQLWLSESRWGLSHPLTLVWVSKLGERG